MCVAVCCSVLQCVAVCCSVLQCVAVCCSVLQCVAVLLSMYLEKELKKQRTQIYKNLSYIHPQARVLNNRVAKTHRMP